MVIKPHLSITPVQVHAGFWWDFSYEQMVSINILNDHPSKGTCIIIYVRQPAARACFSMYTVFMHVWMSYLQLQQMEKSCRLPSVARHHAYFLAKWFINYSTERKKSHHILLFITINLICLLLVRCLLYHYLCFKYSKCFKMPLCKFS